MTRGILKKGSKIHPQHQCQYKIDFFMSLTPSAIFMTGTYPFIFSKHNTGDLFTVVIQFPPLVVCILCRTNEMLSVLGGKQ